MRDFLEVPTLPIVSNVFHPVGEEREAVESYKATLADIRYHLRKMQAASFSGWRLANVAASL